MSFYLLSIIHTSCNSISTKPSTCSNSFNSAFIEETKISKSVDVQQCCTTELIKIANEKSNSGSIVGGVVGGVVGLILIVVVLFIIKNKCYKVEKANKNTFNNVNSENRNPEENNVHNEINANVNNQVQDHDVDKPGLS